MSSIAWKKKWTKENSRAPNKFTLQNGDSKFFGRLHPHFTRPCSFSMRKKTSHRIFILCFNYVKLRQGLNSNEIISLMEIKIVNKFPFALVEKFLVQNLFFLYCFFRVTSIAIKQCINYTKAHSMALAKGVIRLHNNNLQQCKLVLNKHFKHDAWELRLCWREEIIGWKRAQKYVSKRVIRNLSERRRVVMQKTFSLRLVNVFTWNWIIHGTCIYPLLIKSHCWKPLSTNHWRINKKNPDALHSLESIFERILTCHE